MRVLISGHLPPPVGGMATYYQSLLNSDLSKYVDYQFVQTSSHQRELATSGRASFSNLIYAIADCARYTRALIRYRPAIVHIGTAFGLSFLKHSYCVFLARLLRKKIVLHPHCSLQVLYNERSNLWKWFFRQVIDRTDAVIAMSHEWMQLNKVVPACRTCYLPNFVNIDEYQSALETHQNGVKQTGTLSILYLGYLGQAKGSFDLVDSVDLLHRQGLEMNFHLVGSELNAGERAQLQEKVDALELGESIHLDQPAYGEKKISFFRAADIFVYPSYHEGVPMAVLEAMASGLPIIATRVGGLPDLVRENGLLIDPGRPDQLAEALAALKRDPGLRLEMQKNSYAAVCQRFNITKHVADLVEIYRQVSQNSLPVGETVTL